MRATTGSADHKNDNGDGHTSSTGDPTRPPQPRTVNVVLFGDAFVRKSSVLNLIARKEVATVSSDVDGSTMQFTRYDVTLDNINFAIFDTTGLEEPQMGVTGYLKAVEKAYELIVKLSDAGGIHLLLFCVLGGRITATTQSNYRLFFECLCGTKVPIALVFTGLVKEVKIEDWWTRNKTYIEHYGIKNDGHACLRAVQDDTSGEDLAESQRKILDLLKTCALKNEAFSLEPHSWLAKFGKASQSFIRKLRNPKRRNFMRVLTRHCELDPKIAGRIIDMMDRGHAGPTSPTMNVILFGETGVGKSSVINLIAQKEVTQVSSGAEGCTMRSTRYDISFDDMNFAVFDTIGLVQPHIEVSGYLNAIENAYKLIVELGAAGGIHLLLFCMRGSRITATTQNNYRMFYEYLCSKKVPVALVFTGLEREIEMDDWWKRNRAKIENYGIKGDGHACITAVQDDTPSEDLKYTESQRKIRELLKTCALKNEAFTPEPYSWIAGFGKLMKSLVKTHTSMPGRIRIMRLLTQRCDVDPETARKIGDMMERNDANREDAAQAWNRDEYHDDGRDRSAAGNEDLAGGQKPVYQQDNTKDGHRNDPPKEEGCRRRTESGNGGDHSQGLAELTVSEETRHREMHDRTRKSIRDEDVGDWANVNVPEGSHGADEDGYYTVTQQDDTGDERSTGGRSGSQVIKTRNAGGV